MEGNDSVRIEVDFAYSRFSLNNSTSQNPGRLNKVITSAKMPRNLPMLARESSILVEKQILFLRFTVNAENEMQVRIREYEGCSYDGPASSEWAVDALKALQNRTLFQIETNSADGRFCRLINAKAPKIDEPMILDDQISKDLPHNPMDELLFAGIKTEQCDLFDDWLEPKRA